MKKENFSSLRKSVYIRALILRENNYKEKHSITMTAQKSKIIILTINQINEMGNGFRPDYKLITAADS
jgi:hypothetical protein